ncbi:MAG TPA: pullulanase-type alpha-1,6-glucosidase [Chloroflexaceae bacterium]|nr:pullulanase-type alpha-1,6-glucosidase [Chloroflexaceae bacterium]
MARRMLWRPIHLLCAMAIIVGAIGVPGAAVPRAQADHTPAPPRVTVPGNFNQELGCPGDWQPECAATDLADQGNGVWAGTLSVPATNAPYEYKIALNGAWDESYAGRPGVNGNTALAITADTDVRFFYDHKTHFVADNFNQTIYTVPGNFNDELGCAGDWQPECLRTLMSDADGDGVYTFSTDQLPAGSYEFKVATGESWSNPNYGQGGGADNIAFAVGQAGVEVEFSFDSASNVPTVRVANPPPPEDAALLRAPVSDPDNQDEIFYFVMPDRFANGDPANDRGGLTGDALTTGFKPDDKGYYHGGDLAGLMAKLPYIQELGVTAIWMTPMFKNRPVQCDPSQAPSIETCSAGYHGYWPVDFTQIDPHFGSNAEMKSFIAAAQGAGMRVFFDIITNHTADVIAPEGGTSYVPRSDAPYRDAGGNIFDDRDYLFADAFPPMNRYSFPRRPSFRDPADATAKTPGWLNDVTMYHNRGDAAFDGSEGDLYGDFVGLDGLFTERPEVVQGMIDIHNYWISEFGIDGFRVDTVKHVNMEFWQQFVPAIREHAASVGKPDFFIFGEVFSGDPAFMAQYTREGRFPATLDFDFNYSAGDFAAGSAGPGRLSGLFAGDDYYTTADDNAYNQPTFLGNHDIGRFASRLQQVGPDLPDSERVARVALGYGLMFTARGVPIIYYGDEQGFTGDGGDKDARQNMFASQVASYNDDDLIGTDKTTADENFDQDHPLYVTMAELAALRKAHPTLQTGAQIERLSETGGAGVYAFSRIGRDDGVEYVVALNNAEEARAVSVPTFGAAGAGFSALYGATGSLAADAGGRLSLEVPALGMVVYRADGAASGTTGSLGPSISITSPASGGVLPSAGLVEVAASVSGNVMAEVSFAVSVDGGPFQHLGTDTNAPYRVFYDVGGLPAGAEVSFKAVVTDVLGEAGNFNSATAVVSAGAPEVCAVSYEYAVVHYQRPDGNYDGWTVYPFGEGVTSPDYATGSYPFLGRTPYGAFAWIPLDDPTKELGIVIHNNSSGTDVKDPGPDLFFTPAETPQVFIKSGDTTVYPSQAAAQGYVTFHYSREDGDYSNAVLYVFGEGAAESEVGGPFPGDRAFTGSDDYGRYVNVQVGDPTKEIGFIVIKDGVKDPDPDRFMTPAETPAVWLKSGDERVYRTRSEADNVVTLRYHRPAGDYGNYASDNFADFWGLHTWAGTATPNPSWDRPVKPVAVESFGPTFRVGLADDASIWAYILHRGDEKDKQADQFLNLEQTGHEVWILQNMPGDYPYLLPMQPGCQLGLGNATDKLRAHWVTADTIAWPIVASPQVEYTLHYAADAGLRFEGGEVVGGASVPLTLNPDGLSAAVTAKFPHMADLTALTVGADANAVKEILKGQVWVSARTEEQGVVEVTGVQIPGVLDDLYAERARKQRLGVSVRGQIDMRLWAPTAQDVNLLLFPDATSPAAETVEMTLDRNSGVWRATLDYNRLGRYYLYEVKVYAPTTGRIETNLVTDPYAVSLSMNSARSQIVHLDDYRLEPSGWHKLEKPRLAAFEDIVLYELHVRDFSITDETVPEALRGTFKAFTRPNTAGMRHLRELARDGLTHVHLLPVFDIATIDEDASRRTELLDRFDELRAMPPAGEEQQAVTAEVRDLDGFNWGYDPYHFNVPEGSYSTDPNGPARIREFREMVQGLNRSGLRVVMDVVYNHTNAAGQAEKSVFDRVVPGYYHRLNADGAVETSTCCQNTATEHAMMEQFMVDSVVLWAKQYKVDGFRFDLMGHHMKSNMLAVRRALDGLTMAKDGVDGKKIFLYGEGWNFGEVADGRRGVNATQRNMPGTGIATFSDRLRDAVRGGGPFDSGEDARRQGFINGLYTAPNDLNQGTPEQQRAALLHATDLIRVGMAGNLASYPLVNAQGRAVRGEDVDYNGSPGGYTRDPQEVITYIEAHDNETLFDAIQLKAPAGTSLADRVRMHNLGTSIVLLGQGVPFFHAGQELLRSKSGDRNSYNSGDWFNRVDWGLEEHNWGSGLPLVDENAANLDVLRPRLADPAIKPGSAEMERAYEHFRTMLRIRKSSALFRLRTASQISNRVSFLNTGPDQIPGLIVMRIHDQGGNDIDPRHEQIVVLVNADDAPVTFSAASLRGDNLRLHPELRRSSDPALAGAAFDRRSGTFTVPARTTLVYVE